MGLLRTKMTLEGSSRIPLNNGNMTMKTNQRPCTDYWLDIQAAGITAGASSIWSTDIAVSTDLGMVQGSKVQIVNASSEK